jgi:hypothetical protein
MFMHVITVGVGVQVAQVDIIIIFKYFIKVIPLFFATFFTSADDASSGCSANVRIFSYNLSMMAPGSDRQEETGISTKKKEENENKENLW